MSKKETTGELTDRALALKNLKGTPSNLATNHMLAARRLFTKSARRRYKALQRAKARTPSPAERAENLAKMKARFAKRQASGKSFGGIRRPKKNFRSYIKASLYRRRNRRPSPRALSMLAKNNHSARSLRKRRRRRCRGASGGLRCRRSRKLFFRKPRGRFSKTRKVSGKKTYKSGFRSRLSRKRYRPKRNWISRIRTYNRRRKSSIRALSM